MPDQTDFVPSAYGGEDRADLGVGKCGVHVRGALLGTGPHLPRGRILNDDDVEQPLEAGDRLLVDLREVGRRGPSGGEQRDLVAGVNRSRNQDFFGHAAMVPFMGVETRMKRGIVSDEARQRREDMLASQMKAAVVGARHEDDTIALHRRSTQ